MKASHDRSYMDFFIGMIQLSALLLPVWYGQPFYVDTNEDVYTDHTNQDDALFETIKTYNSIVLRVIRFHLQILVTNVEQTHN